MPVILGIESSCDETAAAILDGDRVLSNVIAGQEVHAQYGGVVPELASRAHQEHIVPVVEQALHQAGLERDQLDAVAFTKGPGLIGALLVGGTFARSFAQALSIPLVAVDHLKAHVLAHFIDDENGARKPEFPFLALTVSGGHTMLVLVRSPVDMEVMGRTLDDAAGEAFDKGAKMLGLEYPGGPLIDGLAAKGEPRFLLPEPQVPDLDMSFSGVKTAFLNLIQREKQRDPAFVENDLNDLCASLQNTIVNILVGKLERAAQRLDLKEIALAGGVSANSGLRQRVLNVAQQRGWRVHIPPLVYCTDNAAMIAMAGSMLYDAGRFSGLDETPSARLPF